MGKYDYLLGFGMIGTIAGSITLWGWSGLLFGAGIITLATAIYMNEE
jgi:hypothetical protein